ncbi:hypothetical protein LXL04_007546 [Taraxacum kok-saghyz]
MKIAIQFNYHSIIPCSNVNGLKTNEVLKLIMMVLQLLTFPKIVFYVEAPKDSTRKKNNKEIRFNIE